MNDLEKFNETSLPGKEEFYSNLNIEDIMDLDDHYAKRICKDFELKNLGEYHDLYLESDTLLLADGFENLWFWSLWLDPAKFLQANSRICLGSSLKKDQSKVRIINWYWHVNDRKRI